MEIADTVPTNGEEETRGFLAHELGDEGEELGEMGAELGEDGVAEGLIEGVFGVRLENTILGVDGQEDAHRVH